MDEISRKRWKSWSDSLCCGLLPCVVCAVVGLGEGVTISVHPRPTIPGKIYPPSCCDFKLCPFFRELSFWGRNEHTNVTPPLFRMAILPTSVVFFALFPLSEVACYARLHWTRNDLRLEKRNKSAIYVALLAGWLAYFNLVVSSLGGVPCGLFYVTSLLVAPLSVGPQIIRALTLRGTIKYYQLFVEDEISSRTRRGKETTELKAPSELMETGLPLASGKKAEATLIMERTRGIVKMMKLGLLVVPTLFIILATALTSDASQLLETDFIQCQPEPNSFQYASSALVVMCTVLALAGPFVVKQIDDELHIATEIRRNSIFLGCTHILIFVIRFLGHYEWQPSMQTIQQMFLAISMAIIPFLPSSTTLDRMSSWAKRQGKRINPAIKSAIPGYGRPLPRSQNVIGRRISTRLSAMNTILDRETIVSWDAGLCVLLSSEDGISLFIQHCAKEFR